MAIRDFFNYLKGASADAFDNVAERMRGTHAAGVESMQGARAAAVQPAAAEMGFGRAAQDFTQPARAAPVQPPAARLHPASAGVQPGIRSPLDPRFADPLGASNERIRNMNNPHLATPEGQRAVDAANRNFQGGGRTPPPPGGTPPGGTPPGGTPPGGTPPGGGDIVRATPEEIAAKKKQGGRLWRGAKYAVRNPGNIAAGAIPLAIAEGAFKASRGETPEQLTGQGGALQGGATEAYDLATLGQGRKIAHGVKGAFGAFTGDPDTYNRGRNELEAQIREARAAGDHELAKLRTEQLVSADETVEAPSTFRGGMFGFLGDVGRRFAKGWGEGAQMERDAEGIPLGGARGRAVVPPGGGQQDVDFGLTGNEGAPASDEGLIPTLRGANVTPQELISNTRHVPVPGTGAFQRTTPGNRGQAIGIDTRAAQARDAAQAQQQRTPRIGDIAVAAAKFRGEQLARAGNRADAEVGIKQQQANTAAATAGLAVKEARSKEVNSAIENHVAADSSISSIKDKDERAGVMTQRTADLKRRANYSLGRYNASQGNANPATVNDFLDADKFRNKIDAARGTWKQAFTDYFGNKRYDSSNSFSYMPAYKKGSRLYAANGNSLGATEAVGGEFNWFGPNNPIDADMKRHIDDLPDEATFKARRQKGDK
jgi:hypothetical protein